jgi:hypothetical protein
VLRGAYQRVGEGTSQWLRAPSAVHGDCEHAL